MVIKVKGGWQFGNGKPTTKEKALEQMRAAIANGYDPGRNSDADGYRKKGK
jgi:hypothetical protein